MNTTTVRALIFFVCSVPLLAHGMYNENVEQLAKRFGSNYTLIDRKEMGRSFSTFRIRSQKLNVDVLLYSGHSVRELYYSRIPLGSDGLPPRNALCAILKAYQSGRWTEIDIPKYPPTSADDMLTSQNGNYMATLYCPKQNVEGFKWIVEIAPSKGSPGNRKANAGVWEC